MAQTSQMDLFGPSAPVRFETGAQLAQPAQNNSKGGDLRQCAVWGSAHGANPQPAANWRSQPPSRRDWRKGEATNPEIRKSAIKDLLRELSAERAQLMPAVDSYNSIVGSARDKLRAHHEATGMIGRTDDERKATLALHDRILDACCRYGRSIIAYKRVKSAIEQLSKEMEGLSA